MDRLRKIRAPVRTSFTKTFNQLILEVEAEAPVKDNVQVSVTKLERLYGDLAQLDQQMSDLLLDSDCSGEEYAEERTAVEEYQDRLDLARLRAGKVLNPEVRAVSTTPSLTSASATDLSLRPTGQVKMFRLPELELKKFGGEIKDWLSFWSQFKKIHEDKRIDDGDKFQYLIQYTIPGSRARDLVDSFPPSVENYGKAIEYLKSRFGREDLLVEVYVRELLKLIIQNVSNSKSEVTMSTLYDKLEAQLRALESIGVASDKFAAMLFPLVESCLPADILRAWQRSSESKASEDPGENSNIAGTRLKQLLNFMKCEVEGEARISLARDGFGISQTQVQSKMKKKFQEKKECDLSTAAGLFAGSKEFKKSACVFCEKSHDSKECFQAQRMTLVEKKSVLTEKKCCFVCLKGSHHSKFCKANVRCVLCGKKHFILMCPELPSHKESSGTKSNAPEKKEPTTHIGMSNQSSAQDVILQTLMVVLKGDGRDRTIRAIIDTASHKSYILKKSLVDMGYAPVSSHAVIHALFGGVESARQNHQRYKVALSSLSGNFNCKMNVLDQPVICGNISRVKVGPWFKELKEKNVWISDVGEDCPQIELLIGADVAGKLLTGKVHQLTSGLTAVETRLGWTVMGQVSGETEKSSAMLVTSLLIQESMVASLWKLDTIGISDPVEVKTKGEMEMAAMDHFRKTVCTDSDGRYEIKLPFLEGHPPLLDNKFMAQKRLLSATKKLVDDGRLSEYNAVFEGWLSEGIVEPVPDEELNSFGHYLPHRGVFKDNNPTTKVRPVFDASAHTKNSPSLNECLEKGPNLIELIPSVLAKFREKRIGVVSDIKKAFLQISVVKNDRDFLRFLWWEDISRRQVKTFRHRRVVFGVNCSPFLLGAVLAHHLEMCPPELKSTALKLIKSFYVDNCVTSVSTEEDLQQFVQESKQLLITAKLDLRGWEYTCLRSDDPGPFKPTPVLGLLLWDRQRDELFCDMSEMKDFSGPVTKRIILSVANSVFDPIGFTCPVSLCPKALLQETWGLKLGWDVELPEEISNKFKKWANELSLLSELRIPRKLALTEDSKDSWTLHTFCDASKLAYAAVVYLRSEAEEQVNVQLVMAKSRVAPIKKVTIPRLELLGCTIASRLVTSVKKFLDLENVPMYCWSDSTTALCWIQRDDQWGTFVGNRAKEINTLTEKGVWRHVPGEMNPADLPSRACTAKELLKSRWWEGPTWLKLKEEDWPTSQVKVDETEVNKEKKKGIVSSLLSINRDDRWYMKYFSRYQKIVRMVAWIHRFVKNCRSVVKDRVKSGLNVTELDAAEKFLIKLVQGESLPEEKKKTLQSLSVCEDKDGLSRVNTKIVRRPDNEDFRSPFLLPSNHPLVQALILDEHLLNCHAGVQHVLNSLRERFWILRGRKTIRGVLAKCIRCRRYDAKKLVSVPAPLPEDRVREASVFEIVGVDLAGPLNMKGGEKSWIILFTCAIYRAVHLELIRSLSTDAFLQGLRRFISRRGRPSIVYSDNGTNFVGADNLFKHLDWEKIELIASIHRIQWKFNPPTAAWWGGWWERLIRLMKQLLKRVLGRTTLDYEELLTILCDCESVMNSRPLTFVSEYSDDLVPLTPAMFLQDVKEVGVPDLDSIDRGSLNKRFRHRQKLREDLRQRFRSEYLGQLVQRSGEKGNTRRVNEGDVVLVGSDNMKRLNWPMAKVIEVFPGKDKNIRVVRLKTTTGELVRPIQRIYPLEVSAPEGDLMKSVTKKIADKQPALTAEVPRLFVTRGGRQVIVPNKYPA